jgi:hypothetical protein
MMPTIRNLTENQVALLDEMWACDSFEEYEAFLECLDPTDRKEAERLQRLLLVEILDEEMAKQDEYLEANMVIDKFRLTK